MERLGKERPELPWIETEADPEFIEYIKNFPRDRPPLIRDALASISCERIIFRSREEARARLKNVRY